MPAFAPALPDLRTQFETQVDFLHQLSRHTLDTRKQLNDLNLHMLHQLFDDGVRLGRALASCNNPAQAGALAMGAIPPAADAWRTWQSSLVSVLTASGAMLAHDANDGSWQAARSAAGDMGAPRSSALIQPTHEGEAMASIGSHQDGPADALALLRAEHEQVRRLFAHYQSLRGLEDAEEMMAELVDDLCEVLVSHTMLEEELFYPALRAATGDDELFDDAELEHAGARELISQLEVMYPGDEHFDATLAVLFEEVAHHIAQEEGEMFALARTAGVDLVALGQRLALRRAQLDEDLSAPPTAFDGVPVPHEGRRTPPRAPD
jgi:hypothetical protein